MTQILRAIFEKGVLRPLEPLTLKEHQEVSVTVSDVGESAPDNTYLDTLESRADNSISLEQVRAALSAIPGSMADEINRERDER